MFSISLYYGNILKNVDFSPSELINWPLLTPCGNECSRGARDPPGLEGGPGSASVLIR